MALVRRLGERRALGDVVQVVGIKAEGFTVGGKTLLALIERDELIAQYAVRAR